MICSVIDMMRALAALACFTAFAPQEATLEQVVDRWESAAAAIRPLRLSFDATGIPGPADVEADRDGNVHVSMFPYHGRTADGTPMREWFLAPRGLHVIDRFPTMEPRAGIPVRRLERLEPAACTTLDPSYFPMAQLFQGTPLNESAHSIFLTLLSPRRALAFEANLRLLGRRNLDGEACWVLRAEKALRFHGPATQVRRFFVSVRDHRLLRVDQALSHHKGGRPDRSLWTVAWNDGRPVRVALSTTRNPAEAEWDVAAARRDPPPGPVAPPDDLYATRVRHADFEALAITSPEDPEILASYALRMGRLENWERVVRHSPHATPRINLLRHAVQAKADDLIAEIVRALEADPKAPPSLVIEAARALVQTGRIDAVLPLLERFGADPSDEVRYLRALACPDLKKTFAEVLPMILRADGPTSWSFAATKFPDIEVVRALDEAMKNHPDSAALRIFRFQEIVRMRRIGSIAGALRDCLAVKIDDAQLQVALLSMDPLFRHPDPKFAVNLDHLQAAEPDLLEVLDPARGLHFRKLRFLIRDALGNAEEAEAELKALMEEAAKGDPKLRWLGYSYVTAKYKTSPLYPEAGRRALEAMKAMPRRAQIAYAENPFDTPACAYAQARAAAGDFGALFEALYGLEPDRTDGGSLLIMLQLKDAHLSELGKVALATAPAAKDAHDRLIWAGRLLSTLSMRFPPRPLLPETRACFQRAREAKPDSWPALEGLIATATHDRDFANAAELAREALQRHAKSPGGSKWSAVRLRLILIRNLIRAGETAAAREELGRIDPAGIELDAHDLARAAEMAEEAGLNDRAVALYERLVECGHRPYVRLAELYAGLGRAEESLRAIQEAVDGGFDLYTTDPDRIFVSDARTAPDVDRIDPKKIREGLIEGACGDQAIRDYLARPRAAASEEETRRARAAVARLGDEAIVERDRATKELTDLGPKVAAIVGEAYASSDPQVRRSARVILIRWVLGK